MSLPIYVSETHCVCVNRESKICETDGVKAVERMTDMLLSGREQPKEVKIFEPEGDADATLLVGPPDVCGKKLSEIDLKLLDEIASVWKIYPQESELVERAKKIRKERKNDCYRKP